MKSSSPLITFAVLITILGLYLNWSAAFTEAWWFAVAGGGCLAVLHFASLKTSAALGILGAALLMLALFNVQTDTFGNRAMFSGLACGLLAGLCVGHIVKTVRRRR